MSERKRDAVRRTRFIACVKKLYGERVTEPRSEARATLQKKLKVTKGRMTQLFDPEQAFGEKTSSKTATDLGFAEDYFEYDDPRVEQLVPARPEDEESERRRAQVDRLLFLWVPLFDEQRERLLVEIENENVAALKTWDEIKRRGWDQPVGDAKIPPEFTRPAQRDLPIEPPPAPAKTSGKRPKK